MSNNRLFINSVILVFAFAATLTASIQPQKVTLRVDGLACPFCAYGLEKKLKRIEGVEKLEIRINEGVVILHFKEGTKIDKELIAKKVKEAGFTPKEMQIEGESKEVAVQSDTIKGRKITLNIEGMTCEGCVSRVKTALNNLDCVQAVVVNLSEEKVTFTCTDDKFEQTKFIQAIEDIGFKAKVKNKKR